MISPHPAQFSLAQPTHSHSPLMDWDGIPAATSAPTGHFMWVACPSSPSLSLSFVLPSLLPSFSPLFPYECC
uniref:Uncharacterized protein n=1 Tax=Physcomitrium patens TaxID=3218 RepID=A0A2K1IKB7_PHYPA|nr:hypothetical protein PHYPA_028418 [Physcomitrium patens]